MTRVRRIVGGAIGAWMVASAATAQEMTVEDLVLIALERAPEIRAARTAISAAEGELTQATLRPSPSVAMSQQEQMGGADRQTAVGVEWPLELFRRSSRIATARQMLEATTLSVRDREVMLASQVREKAGRFLAARRTLEVTSEALASTRRTRDLLDRRASEGGIPQLEANIAAVEVWRMEADAALASGEVDAAAIELKAIAGLDLDATLVLRDSLESLVRATLRDEPDQPRSQILAVRPDIREAVAQVAFGEARVEAARRAGDLDMALTGGYGRMRLGFPFRGFDAVGRQAPIEMVSHSLAVGARLTLPLWNRNQGAVAAAQANVSGARETLVARERAARAELDAALVRDRQARRAVELYASSAREMARKNADVVLEAYDLGGIALSEVLVEQRRYLEVEAAYTAVLSRAYEARVALRLARGEVR